MKRLLSWGSLGVLSILALAGCGSGAASANAATPTPTCPAAPQFQQATGTITAVDGSQMTVQTTRGEALVNLSSRTRYTMQEKTSQSDVQDGVRVQVIVKSNSDGAYSAVQVAIRQAPTGNGGGNGGGFPGGNGGNGGNGNGNRGGTPVPARCRTGRGGNGGAFGSGGAAEGGLPSGAKVLSGTVSTISGPNMTITANDGADYNVKLDSTTVYSKIGAAKVSDLKVGQMVLAIGAKGANGSINAQAVTILLALPTSQA
jgi:Cu/Ag efflux protein CusF